MQELVTEQQCRNGYTVADLKAEYRGTVLYASARKQFCIHMDTLGVDYSFGMEKRINPDVELEYIEHQQQRAIQAISEGDTEKAMECLKEVEELKTLLKLYEYSQKEKRIVAPEVQSLPFTLELVKGTEAFKIVGGGYLLPSQYKWIK